MDVKWESEDKRGTVRVDWSPCQSACSFGDVGVPQETLVPSVVQPYSHLAQALEKLKMTWEEDPAPGLATAPHRQASR